MERMIEPGHETNELTDLSDHYMVSLRLGGVMDKLPDHLYVDGIDQTSYLLTEKGRSLRQVVILWNSTNFCALRWRDYKVHFNVFDIAQTRRNMDATTLSNDGTAPWVFNLNVDPKEMASEGHRLFEWGIPAVIALQRRHLASMKKYPKPDLGLDF